MAITGLVLVVSAVYHHYDLHNPRRETIPNPVVAISAVEATTFEPGWKNGYHLKPYAKEKRKDGTTLLLYREEIKNNALRLRLENIDFGSFTTNGRHWLVKDKSTLRQTKIKCPEITLAALNIKRFATQHANLYPSYPGSKNLQPDGTVILSAGVRISEHQIGIVLPAGYAYKSKKRENAHFTVKWLPPPDDD